MNIYAGQSLIACIITAIVGMALYGCSKIMTTVVTYYVGSNGNEPEQIYFTFKAATEDEPDYIDGFDEDGYRVPRASYKFVDGSYTQEF